MTMTHATHESPRRGWVLYDSGCSLCTSAIRRLEGALRPRGFGVAPLQSPWVCERLGTPAGEQPEEMKVVTADGRILGGADAIIHLARYIWWAWPLFALSQIPGMKGPAAQAYRWVAANRHCLSGTCRRAPVASRLQVVLTQFSRWAPLVGLPLLVIACRGEMPAWALMWLLAFAIYAGCKWLTWHAARDAARAATRGRNMGYLLAWPGMDARRFLDSLKTTRPCSRREIAESCIQMLCGALLLWGAARLLPATWPLGQGWLGMIGLLLLLHFGLFALLATAWRAGGVAADPIMNAPLRATSLGDFWANRWNRGFHRLAYDFVYRPAVRRIGPHPAMLLAFLASGVVHDLVISLPAGGGFGLPTAYFIMQGLGVLIERSAVGRRAGLRRGVRGRCFTLIVTTVPAAMVFHPAFVLNVMRPFMIAIGAL